MAGSVVDVHIEHAGGQYSLYLHWSDGELTVTRGSDVVGGLRHPGDVLLHLLARKVPMQDVVRYLEKVEPAFDAYAELHRRSETDMAAWRMADHLRREQLKEEFRRTRDA
ncbi:hypothetical protein GCM10010435_64780 [Winogradskya consettensis]|uniref:Uncharacterized protein n=1 Tax=Winogradskya consettensis TaxID=113560 RepID=A0A919VQ76_9ACTN|nr:hypothetical protein [Actinoplanes consettensis]GIM72221.1 hypothetical protein Aco04nite_29180 [Actinoplanes consettensis]